MTAGVPVTFDAGIKRSHNTDKPPDSYLDSRHTFFLSPFSLFSLVFSPSKHHFLWFSFISFISFFLFPSLSISMESHHCPQFTLATTGHRRCDLLYLHRYTVVGTAISMLQRRCTPHHRRLNLTWTKTPPMASIAIAIAITTITTIIAVDKASQPLIVVAQVPALQMKEMTLARGGEEQY